MQFSPSGDYFTSGGNDSVVMIWKSNLNQFEQELIDDFGGKTSQLPIDDIKPSTAGVVKPVARPQTAVVKSKMNSESKAPAAKSVVSSAQKQPPQMVKVPKSSL